MTNITELAQSLKAAAEKATQGDWRAFQYHDGRCGIGGGHNAEIMVCEHISKERPHDAMFIALANPANVLALVEALEKAQQRIAELEESNAQVIQSRDHYKRMTEEGLKQLAEARTVKLPDLRQIVSGDRYVWSDGVYNYSQDVKVALAAAGIKVEAE
ncbi:ead/Ea22-like family protein [Klebsiella variicola]|uniref:ead/Ea22-like family protein n=1 Tax=Klebsiella variicola TaxID=244366 RepID=UPI0035A3C1E2